MVKVLAAMTMRQPMPRTRKLMQVSGSGFRV